MRLTKHAIALTVAGLMAVTSQVSALTIGDANYLGSINDGIPSNPADEVGYINLLITLGPGALPIVLPPGTGTETYSRVDSTLAGPFPTVVLAGSVKDESGGLTINATGYKYILGKYDAAAAGSLVWYFADGAAGNVTLPSSFSGRGLSHISLYNGGGTSVPDGGTTAMLLGVALSGLAMLRRFIS